MSRSCDPRNLLSVLDRRIFRASERYEQSQGLGASRLSSYLCSLSDPRFTGLHSQRDQARQGYHPINCHHFCTLVALTAILKTAIAEDNHQQMAGTVDLLRRLPEKRQVSSIHHLQLHVCGMGKIASKSKMGLDMDLRVLEPTKLPGWLINLAAFGLCT